MTDIFLKVLRMDNFRCKNPDCNAYTNHTPHHIKYRSQGGKDTEGDLITFCLLCHIIATSGGIWRGEHVSAHQFVIKVLEHWMLVAAKGLIDFRWQDAYDYIKSLPDRRVR